MKFGVRDAHRGGNDVTGIYTDTYERLQNYYIYT